MRPSIRWQQVAEDTVAGGRDHFAKWHRAPYAGSPGAVPARGADAGRRRPENGHRQTARAVRQRQRRRGSPARAALLPVRALPVDRLLARGLTAGEPAGRVEPPRHAAVELRLPRQHQPADELLAGGRRESRRDHAAAVRFRRTPGAAGQTRRAALLRRRRLDHVPQHQRVGLRRPHRLAHGVLAARGFRLAGAAFLRALSVQPGRGVPEEARLAGHERRGRVLARCAGRPIRATANSS